MNIVIADDYQDCVRSLDCFAKLAGHEVTVYTDTTKNLDELAERFSQAQAIVLIRERTRITRDLLRRLPHLKLIAQTGKISTHVDLQACAQAGVTVTDGRGSGAATAELNMLLILAGLRHLVVECNRLKSGLWQGMLGRQLQGRVVGIYGFGRIGEQVAHLCRAFGAHPLIWGRSSTLQRAGEHGFAVAATREEFFSQCDVLTLQMRLNDGTRHAVTAEDLALMKPDALLVNASRAELIAPGALVRALQQGRPGFAAVDVYEDEPVLGGRDPLLALPNCLCSPHLGFVERDNYEAYFGIAFDNINAFARGSAQNTVTL